MIKIANCSVDKTPISRCPYQYRLQSVCSIISKWFDIECQQPFWKWCCTRIYYVKIL